MGYVTLLVLVVLGVIYYLFFVQPKKEAEISRKLDGNAEIILGILTRNGRNRNSIKLTAIVNEFRGIKNPQKVIAQAVGKLSSLGCAKRVDKERLQATPRGLRVAKIIFKSRA